MAELPATSQRVPLHTRQNVNERIMERTLDDIAAYEDAEPELKTARLRELDREWDTDRVFEATDGAILLTAGVLGLLTSRRWLFLVPLAVGGFLLQQALQGWCPQLPLLRRLGVRTSYEIAGEKAALQR